MGGCYIKENFYLQYVFRRMDFGKFKAPQIAVNLIEFDIANPIFSSNRIIKGGHGKLMMAKIKIEITTSLVITLNRRTEH